MKVCLIISLLLISIISCSYANVNSDLVAIEKLSDNQKDSVTAKNLLTINKNAHFAKSKYQNYLSQLINKKKALINDKKRAGRHADGAILFVSFSMPESMLLEMSDEAEKMGISVVLKGLVDGDFQKTFEKIVMLQEKASQSNHQLNGFLVNPIWFEQFEIEAVPTLVVTKRPSTCFNELVCPNQKYDAVSGNIKITKSLKLIAERGDHMQELAQQILEGNYV